MKLDTSTLTDEPGGHRDATPGVGPRPTPAYTVIYTGKLHHHRGRYLALGRENRLFAGSGQGGHRAASIFSLVETAKLNGVDPKALLTDTITRIADHPARRVADPLP